MARFAAAHVSSVTDRAKDTSVDINYSLFGSVTKPASTYALKYSMGTILTSPLTSPDAENERDRTRRESRHYDG